MDESGRQQAPVDEQEAKDGGTADKRQPQGKKREKKRKRVFAKVIFCLIIAAVVIFLTLFLTFKISDGFETMSDMLEYIADEAGLLFA